MIINKRLKGSITIFGVLSIVIIVTLLFTLLEAARSTGLRMQTDGRAQRETESVFAAYHKELYDKYGLFFLEGSGGNNTYVPVKDEVIQSCENTLDHDFLEATLVASELVAYQLSTDSSGNVLRKQAAICAKGEAAADAVKKVMDKLEDGDYSEEAIEKERQKALSTQDAIDDGKRAYEEASKDSDEGKPGDLQTEEQKALVAKYGNPLELLKGWGCEFALQNVIEDMSKVSNKRIDVTNLLSNRSSISQGKAISTLECASDNAKITDADNALFITYLNKYFGYYTKGEKGDKALDYELEYILCGKKSDKENLNSVVTKLFLIREVCNYKTILSDADKCSLAQSLAVAILTPFGLTFLTEPVKQGILLAWAYGESVLDIRTILSGEKVSFIKSPSEWTLQLENLGNIFNKSFKAKSNSNGMSYQNYLWALLFIENHKKQNYKTMDLIEVNIRNTIGNSGFKMDNMIQAAKLDYSYSSHNIFLSLMMKVGDEPGSYLMSIQKEFSY